MIWAGSEIVLAKHQHWQGWECCLQLESHLSHRSTNCLCRALLLRSVLAALYGLIPATGDPALYPG